MAKGPAEIAHGPMLIGFFFNALLYGIMITQVYLYFTTYKSDKMWMKIFVLVLFIADTINAVFDFVYLYNALIIHFADIAYLADADWVFATDPAITAIIASLVQLFFAYRVKVLTKSNSLSSIIGICAISGAVSGILTAFEVGITPHFVDFRRFKSVVIIWLASESVGDAIITGALVWHLVTSAWSYRRTNSKFLQRRHKTGFPASDALIDRLIRLVVQTGLLTSLCATLDLIFFLTDPTGTHLIFNFPLSKLYTNSLMSSLNSRGGWNFTPSTCRTPVNMLGRPVLHETANKTISQFPQFAERPEVFIHVESHELHDVDGKGTKQDATPVEVSWRELAVDAVDQV